MSTPVPHTTALQISGFGGVPISAAIRPAEGGVPVMLVHGFGSSAKANWAGTGWLDSLAKAGLTSVTVDLRGHGLSGKPHDPAAYRLPYLLADLRAALAGLAEVLGPVPVIDLVGYSMGGRMVAELIAAATGSGLGAVADPWDPGLPTVRRAVIGGYDGRPLLDGVVLDEFRAALAGARGPVTPSSRIAAIAKAGPGNDLVALSALVEGLAPASSQLPAAAVPVPTLVVAGDRDSITDGTRGWAAGLPDGRHLELSGRTHVSAVTSAVFRSAATDFLLAEAV